MTTIACDLNGMAADSFISDGHRATKILRGNGMLIGFSGKLYNCLAVAEWVLGGQRGPCPVTGEDTDETMLLLLDRSGIAIVSAGGRRAQLACDYAAIGTGSDIALGAMFAGAPPEDAVRAAAKHDEGTKEPVVYEPLKTTRRNGKC